MTTAFITGYILLGLLFTRWPLGMFIRHAGFPLDGEERAMAALLGVLTVALWPLVAVGVTGYGLVKVFNKSPLGPSTRKALRWFYTLDRDDRKELLR